MQLDDDGLAVHAFADVEPFEDQVKLGGQRFIGLEPRLTGLAKVHRAGHGLSLGVCASAANRAAPIRRRIGRLSGVHQWHSSSFVVKFAVCPVVRLLAPHINNENTFG